MKQIAISVLTASTLGAGLAAQAETLYGLSAGNALVKFDSSTPWATSTKLITGLADGEHLLGIDFRPATGEVFSAGSSNRLYTIDRATGAATLAGTGS